MLVLTRREKEKLVFPSIGVKIEILKTSGNRVRVGIDAPPEVRVLRQELARAPNPPEAEPVTKERAEMSDHRFRNLLHKLQLGMHLLQRQSQGELTSDGEDTLRKVLAEFREVDQGLVRAQAPSDGPKPPRTLVVEDDKNESELLAGFLRLSGFNVDVACDGCDALDYLAKRGRPEIVLLDMHMPRCDGPRTLSAIRRHPDYRKLSVFGVSGRKPDDVGIHVGPGGVDRWFMKPVNPELLVREMHHHLKTAKALV